MPDGLYEQDSLAWSDRQAALLRRLAAGEGVNEAIDWPHVIEEVQDVGLSELRAVESLLEQAIKHLLKAHAWPASRSNDHWIDEAGTFLDDARRRYTASMRQRIDLPGLYATAFLRVLATKDDSGTRNSFPSPCPFTLSDLLAADIPALLEKLSAGER